MNLDLTSISAHVYRESDKGIMYLKVSIPSIGMYVSMFTARTSPNHPESGLWVQTPALYMGHKWMKPLEFANDSLLWNAIQDEVNRAADRYRHEKLASTVPEDVDLANIKAQWPAAEVESGTKSL